ncbi:MAG: hypothetical protein IKL44_05295 [Clostridia bacterium]|nr:hypothetical protein [Clostridia bacterium]MBR3594074.1 hypothetical protein [Clostridia bacterium]
MQNNIDRKKLLEAISALSKNENLKKAVSDGNFSGILASLPADQAKELSSLMNDKAARDKLMSSPQAAELLKRFKQDGK